MLVLHSHESLDDPLDTTGAFVGLLLLIPYEVFVNIIINSGTCILYGSVRASRVLIIYYTGNIIDLPGRILFLSLYNSLASRVFHDIL